MKEKTAFNLTNLINTFLTNKIKCIDLSLLANKHVFVRKYEINPQKMWNFFAFPDKDINFDVNKIKKNMFRFSVVLLKPNKINFQTFEF